MTYDDLPEVLSAILRQDFASFVAKCFHDCEGIWLLDNWHIHVVCEEIIACMKGDTNRLIINMPPRSLKSFIVSVALPAWLMGHDPRTQLITISYSQELAAKFSRQQRFIMEQQWYRRLFPRTAINPRKCGETEFETTGGGFRYATSVGGAITGRGANLIIIDDPIKPQDALSDTKRNATNEWIGNTLLSRLNDKEKGIIILVMQRVHTDDLTGFLQEKGGWKILSLPAIAPENCQFALGNGRVFDWKAGDALHPARESVALLEKLKKEMGSFVFNTQYLQAPVPLEGNIVKREWFRYYERLPIDGMVVQSWDIAMTNFDGSDWSVCTTWVKSRKCYYLIDVCRKRMQFPELKRQVIELRRRHGARAALIESCPTSLPLIQQLRFEGRHAIAIKPTGDKKERLASASLALEEGRVFFPANKPSWLGDFCAELLAFPGRHDDQVDSFSQFINWAERRYHNRARVWQL